MTVSNYLWDEDSYLEEYDEVGTTAAAYTNEPTEFGNVVSQRRNSTTCFYHCDVQGSTHQLTDLNANVTDTFSYDAWGSVVSSTGTTINPFRWIGNVGYYWDEETETYYIRARTYLPTIGRWLSFDPLGFVSTLNLFCYIENQVTKLRDPSGERCIPSSPPIPLTVKPDPHGVINHNWQPQPKTGYRVDTNIGRSIRCTCCDGIDCCNLDIEITVRAYRYYRYNSDGKPVGHNGGLIGVSNDPRDFASMVIIDVCRSNIVCCGVPVDEDWNYSLKSDLFYEKGRGTYIRQGNGDIENAAKSFNPKNADCCDLGEELIMHIKKNVVPGDVDG